VTTAPTNERVLLGFLTPSSNTRLEPLTARIVSGLADVSVHFSRFRVVDVSLADNAASQFDDRHLLAAAELLADARVDVIALSGTSGGWRGLDADRALCSAITERTGKPATTSTLALIEALGRSDSHRLGMVTPCPDDMQALIEQNLARAGISTTSSRNLGISANWELSEIDGPTLTGLVGEVAASRPDAITTFCTNFAAADLVEGWECEHDVAVFDSVALAVWRALELAGVPPGRVTGWGRLFQLP
jgi:maleate isomerase